MYRLREMDIDDKVCEQVDMALLAQVYPKEEIEKCVGRVSTGGAKPPGAPKCSAGFGVVCDSDGAVEPSSRAWCGKNWWES